MIEHSYSSETSTPNPTSSIDLSGSLIVHIDNESEDEHTPERISFDTVSSNTESNGDRVSFCHATIIDFSGISELARQIQNGENEQEARSQLNILLEARGLVEAQVHNI
jgi:hypothetical protein